MTAAKILASNSNIPVTYLQHCIATKKLAVERKKTHCQAHLRSPLGHCPHRLSHGVHVDLTLLMPSNTAVTLSRTQCPAFSFAFPLTPSSKLYLVVSFT
jgi:hypothetical protein